MILNKIKINDTATVTPGVVYDISKATRRSYDTLADALGTDGKNVPSEVREGGMSVRFILTSDNKYIQARCMSQNFTTDVTQWQVVDDVPTAGSDNLVSSGGVYNSTNLFSHPMLNRIIKELYLPNTNYKNIALCSIIIANFIESSQKYQNSIVLRDENQNVVANIFGNKLYDTEEEAVADIISINGFYELPAGGFAFMNIDENLRGIYYNKVECFVNKDISNIVYSPTIKTYIIESYLSTKATKVKNAVVGNLASLNNEGNIIDSGKNSSDFLNINVQNLTEDQKKQVKSNIDIDINTVKTSEYKKVDIDSNNNIYHSVDKDDIEHFYLDQIFHGNVVINKLNVPKKLKVLVVGNSFSGDLLAYISNFIIQSGSRVNDITIYKLSVTGGYLEFWSNVLDANDPIGNHNNSGNPAKLIKIYGDTINISSNNTLLEIFSYDWDVLVLKQVSAYCIDYTTFNPYLNKILTAFFKVCTNKKCKFAWMWSWSRGNEQSISEDIKMLTGWNNIKNVIRQLDSDFGRRIDIFIPAGTAIQNARNTALNPIGDFTRDWHHVATGYGQWMTTACFYETIIAPFNGVSIRDFDCLITVSQEVIDQWYNDYGTVVGSVTSENINTFRKCVEYAITNPFEVV